MAIVINGSGTVTGISVGGLPDGIVDAGTLATDSVDSAELIDGAIDAAHLASGVGGKILKVQSYTDTTDRSHTTNTPTDSGLSFSFTPVSTDGTLVYIFSIALAQPDSSQYGGCQVKVGGVVKAKTMINGSNYTNRREVMWGKTVTHSLVSGSAVVFTVELYTGDNTVYMNRPNFVSASDAYTFDFVTTLTIFEVSA
jgi:hypothetical protein